MGRPSLAVLVLDFAMRTDRLYRYVEQAERPSPSHHREVDPTDSMDALTDDGSVSPQPERPRRVAAQR